MNTEPLSLLATHKGRLKKLTRILFAILSYLFLISLSFVFLYPFLYMISMSLKSFQDLNNVSINWIPSAFSLKNYAEAISVMKLPQTVRNSVIVTGIATLGHLFSASFVGYGFARFKFPFKNPLFIIVILSTVIPIQSLIIPLYINYNNLKMIDTFLPLILPTFFGFGLRGGIFIFLFRQYFYGFPATLEEAALIDGCGRIRGFFKIALPSAGSVIVVTSVLSMVWHWNDYYEPSMYLTGGAKTAMVTQLLPQMYSLLSATPSQSGNMLEEMTRYHAGVVMAATAITIIPLMAAYFILQKRFVESIDRTGLVG